MQVSSIGGQGIDKWGKRQEAVQKNNEAIMGEPRAGGEGDSLKQKTKSRLTDYFNSVEGLLWCDGCWMFLGYFRMDLVTLLIGECQGMLQLGAIQCVQVSSGK